MVCIDGIQYYRADCGKMVRVGDEHPGCIPCVLSNCQPIFD